jgi:hypothetical protein
MPSQEILNQKNSVPNAEQVSESTLELVPEPKQGYKTSAPPNPPRRRVGLFHSRRGKEKTR